MELSAYFDDLMRRRPENKSGYINLPKENFRKMVERAKNDSDLKTLVYAHVNYIGHRNTLPHTYIDLMVMKALELGHPEIMFETFNLHSELLYHPSPNVVKAYLDYLVDKDYELLKKFFDATSGNYLMIKPPGFFATILDKAHENGDKKTACEAYCLAFNYDEFTTEHLIKVFESLRYDELIDHGLVQHLNKQIESRNLS